MTRQSLLLSLGPFVLLAASLAACGGSDTGTGGAGTSSVVGTTASTPTTTSVETTTSGSMSTASGTGSGSGGAGQVERLSTSGQKILDPAGNPIVLRGWNWGQWGTQQPQDAADNKQQGATIVRIPIRWWGNYDTGTDSYDAGGDASTGYMLKANLMIVDQEIADITGQGMWVDLFVDSNCGQNSVQNDTVVNCGAAADGTPRNLTNDAEMKQRFIALWSFLANRYHDHPYIGVYEILSEPNFGCTQTSCADWSVIPAFYESVIPAIRQNDPKTPVMVGPGATYNIKHVDTALLTGVDNVIYTGDMLNGGAHDTTSLDDALQFRSTANVPLFIQQMGVRQDDNLAPDGVTNVMQQALTALHDDEIGWTWWTYRERHSSPGTGYAPYHQNADLTWSPPDAWLGQITAFF